MLAQHPSYTPGQVKGALMLAAAQPAAPTSANSLGVGLVSASAAAAVSNPPSSWNSSSWNAASWD